MKNYKYIYVVIFSVFILVVLSSYILFKTNKFKFSCFFIGDKILDDLIGSNSDCYERKIKGIIFPDQKFNGSRYNVVQNKTRVDCPKNSPIIILSGQSNASNFLKSFKNYSNNHYNYFNGACYEFSSPTLGAEGEMSSLGPAIASKLKTNEKFIFITSGIGGISIEEANISNKEFIFYNIDALENLNELNNYLKYFIWIHGEANNNKTENYYEYFKEMYLKILNPSRINKVNLIITETSLCKNKPDSILSEIQRKILNDFHKGSKIIKTNDLGENYRYDNCHFNERGIETISFRISELINFIENE